LSEAFTPSVGLRNPHVQSVLNSSGLRRLFVLRRARRVLEGQQEWIMDGGNGVRLVGHYTPQPRNHPSNHPGRRSGVAVLLHGWEGSSMSNYILSTAAHLFDLGFSVFRLNFRDHGDSHHLNPGVFHSCRLEEVLGALGDMQERTGTGRWGIAGFSLGGNFALRVALHGPGRGLTVSRCVAICPVLDPERVLKKMETGPTFYENYYNRKWARSLRKKQACFPDRYDYREWYRLPSMRERTRYLATRYYGYLRLEDYFDGYSIAGDRLAALAVRSSILTSEDDPVVPVEDLDTLPCNPLIEVEVTRYGGHCGYFMNWRLNSWAEPWIASRLQDGTAGTDD